MMMMVVVVMVVAVATESYGARCRLHPPKVPINSRNRCSIRANNLVRVVMERGHTIKHEYIFVLMVVHLPRCKLSLRNGCLVIVMRLLP